MVRLRREKDQPGGDGFSDAQRLRYWWGAERERLLAVIGGTSAALSREPLGDGEWSARGIVAHRLFWEAEEREALEEYLSGQTPRLLEFPVERIDATNASAVAALSSREWDALQGALRRLRERSRTLVERIPDEDLNTPGNAARILLGVALEHDREHRRELETWLDAKLRSA